MVTQTKNRPGQHDDESAFEYLGRATSWLAYEHGSLLRDLATVDAVLDFFDLWHEYGTDLWQGILECIADGDSPDKAMAFVKKHKLPRQWSEAIEFAVECREPCEAT